MTSRDRWQPLMDIRSKSKGRWSVPRESASCLRGRHFPPYKRAVTLKLGLDPMALGLVANGHAQSLPSFRLGTTRVNGRDLDVGRGPQTIAFRSIAERVRTEVSLSPASADSGRTMLDLRHLPAGVYFLETADERRSCKLVLARPGGCAMT